MMTNSVYPADDFIGGTLNVFDLSVNGYPVSFILWNIFLAFLAIILAQWTAEILLSHKKWYWKLGAFLLWLVIFPNAAYVMTDARHVIGYCPLFSYGKVCDYNAWMSLFFFAFGAIGWPAFVLTLRPMKKTIAKLYNKTISSVFVIIMCLLAAWGILIGLVNRFNSWDIVVSPLKVIKAALKYWTNDILFFNLVMVFIILLVLYIVGERIFIKPKRELND